MARWDQPVEDLATVDAQHTTLVLADPLYTALIKNQLSAALQTFLMKGGRLLVTGANGALLLPGGAVEGSRRLNALCFTVPEGPGRLARSGEVAMQDVARWAAETPSVFVEHRCGPDAVVVRMPVGAGEAVWWSSAGPLTNAQLSQESALKLLLASLGDGRRVLFHESLHEPVLSPWSAAQGLPLWWMLGQTGLLLLLLLFSFSRRREPIRLPAGVPRSSPLEFAASMGDLYERAGATGAATEAARRRLERVLLRNAGISQQVLQHGPEAIVHALSERFGEGWRELGNHLTEAIQAADVTLRPRSALALVRALGDDAERIRAAAQTPSKTSAEKVEFR
ncbi:MAG: hypothetical protein INR62_10320 [Rhodospirillales bacterium]|nr:hypothetical protein [Acetobacter sp.]